MTDINRIIAENRKIIAMWGYPDPRLFAEMVRQYPNHEIVDFDVNFNFPSSNILPDAYCRIITNILDNAIALKSQTDLVIASVGEEKCDAARVASKVLRDLGFNVVESKYSKYNHDAAPTPIAKSDLPLKEKVCKIMDGVIVPQKFDLKETHPEFGFWGVPPNDMSLLELFPDTTHVYGWTRCVEAKRPADLDLEMYVDESVPTVFFAQTFCAKMQLAKYLAKKHNGLYVDVDDIVSNSVRAKVEAFIRLG